MRRLPSKLAIRHSLRCATCSSTQMSSCMSTEHADKSELPLNSRLGRRLFPCGQTRREFVWEMGGGFAGLALSSLLAQDGFFARQARGDQAARGETPRASKPAHAPAAARSCIFLMMNGGPSHVDTFDYKPTLAKYSGKTLPPEKQFTNSGNRKMGFLTPAWRKFQPGGQSGLMISDYFPR